MENKADEKVRGILDEAFARYKAAESKYGVPDFELDPRDFIKEAIEELQDTIVYAAFQIERLRRLRDKIDFYMKGLDICISPEDSTALAERILEVYKKLKGSDTPSIEIHRRF